MNRNEIEITVSGRSATGKSSICELISQKLKEVGFENIKVVNLDDKVMIDKGERDYTKNQDTIRENLDRAIPEIVNKNRKISIKEKQVNNTMQIWMY